MSAHAWTRSLAPLGLGLGLGLACRLPNPDHCLHMAADANAWCAEHHEGAPYCSPCAEQRSGCVEQEPSAEECPEYTAPAPSDSSDSDASDSDASDSTG